jgi:hypothetical protein
MKIPIDLPRIGTEFTGGACSWPAYEPAADRILDAARVTAFQGQVDQLGEQEPVVAELEDLQRPTLSTRAGDFVYDESRFDPASIDMARALNNISAAHGVRRYLGWWETRNTQLPAELTIIHRGLLRAAGLARANIFTRKLP